MPACSESIPAPALAAGDSAAAPVCVLQLARLGDFLQSTPLLAALRRRHPGRPLVMVVNPAQEPLARACPLVDRVVVVHSDALQGLLAGGGPVSAGDRQRWRELTAPLAELRPAEVYNLNLSRLAGRLAGFWPRAHQGAWRLMPGGRLVNRPWVRLVMNLVADRRLTRLHLCDILASYADPPGPPLARLCQEVAPPARRRAARLLGGDGSPLVVLQLGANSDLRRWPLQSFAGLARELLAWGARPVLVGSAGEAGLGRRLRRMLGEASDGVCDLMGRTDLPTLAAVLERAALVVSGDTGTLHLATAVGAPVLALFMGPAQVHETGPYGEGHLVFQARDACGPCQEQNPACHGQAPCRRLLSPELVWRAARGLLEGTAAEQVGSALEPVPGVQVWQSRLDLFGQRYRPLRPIPLSAQDALALALREAGRVLMRSNYRPEPERLAAELSGEYLPPAASVRDALRDLAQGGAELVRVVERAGRTELEAFLRRWPRLAFLGALALEGEVDRLPAACRAARQVLQAAAD